MLFTPKVFSQTGVTSTCEALKQTSDFTADQEPSVKKLKKMVGKASNDEVLDYAIYLHDLLLPKNIKYYDDFQRASTGESYPNQKAIEENTRLEQLIENILNATRIENKALKPILTEFQFSNFAQQIVDRFHKRTAKPFIELDLKNDALIHADQFLLESILTNLIENAIKYAGENGEIKVYAKATTKSFVFGVQDAGPGIVAAEQKNIFEKFYRVGNEDTRTNKGSGLGLYIVSEFVQLQGGHISYRANEPKGSIFEVTLPI
jgi:K+-sensing histidine kinase KdpD